MGGVGCLSLPMFAIAGGVASYVACTDDDTLFRKNTTDPVAALLMLNASTGTVMTAVPCAE